MNSDFVDYSYALNFLKRLNAVVETRADLYHVFDYEGYDLLQMYQGALFADIKKWSAHKQVVSIFPHVSLMVRIKNFIGTLFIVCITFLSCGFLVVSRRQTLIFSSDKTEGKFKEDFRLRTLYRVLYDTRTPFVEILHVTPGKEAIKNFIRRRRPVLYVETIDHLIAPFLFSKKRHFHTHLARLDLKDFTVEESVFARLLIEKYSIATFVFRARVWFLQQILSASAVARIFSIDDVRHYNDLVYAASTLAIPTYAIQHGHFTKYHTGWLHMTHQEKKIVKPDRILVWSDYWKQELLRLGTYFTPEEIIVAGEHWETVPTRRQDNARAIVIPYEKDGPKLVIRQYIEALLASGAYEIIFKLRADQDKLEQLREYGLENEEPHITIVKALRDVLPRIALAVGTYSTFLYDMVLEERPVCILDTPLDYGDGMIENDLAHRLTLTDIMSGVLEREINTSETELRKRRNKLLGNHPIRQEDTIEALLTHD